MQTVFHFFIACLKFLGLIFKVPQMFLWFVLLPWELNKTASRISPYHFQLLLNLLFFSQPKSSFISIWLVLALGYQFSSHLVNNIDIAGVISHYLTLIVHFLLHLLPDDWDYRQPIFFAFCWHLQFPGFTCLIPVNSDRFFSITFEYFEKNYPFEKCVEYLP